MFYTYLRGLVVLLLWSINGNAHYHNTDKILIKMKIIFQLRLTVPGGILFIWPLRPSQNSSSLWQKKELFTNRIFGWWIRMCGAFPIDRENPSASAIKYPINVLKKVTALSSCFQVVAATQTMSRGRSTDCQNGQGPYHAGYLHRSHDFEGLD